MLFFDAVAKKYIPVFTFFAEFVCGGCFQRIGGGYNWV